MGKMRSAYKSLVGKPKGKMPLRNRPRWEANIRMDLRDTGWKVVGLINLVQKRDQLRDFVHTVMNLRVPKRRGI
jgi:hypothetical protein